MYSILRKFTVHLPGLMAPVMAPEGLHILRSLNIKILEYTHIIINGVCPFNVVMHDLYIVYIPKIPFT